MAIQQMFLGVVPSGVSGFYGERGIFATGYDGGESNVIDYVNIASTGNFTDFGDLQVARRAGGCCTGSASARMCIGGGYDQGGNDGTSTQNVIGYITCASTGNATNFGDLTVKRYAVSACSSTERGVWCFGQNESGNYTNHLDYVTIASTGNATDFGDTTYSARSVFACSNGDRGICGGGTPGNDQIDYFTIGTTGNASDFGDLLTGMNGYQAAASGSDDMDRGVICGGYDPGVSDVMQYITISSTGNCTDFGNMVVERQGGGACSNGTRLITGGGNTPSTSSTNEVDYITVASTGNASDFGDLTVGRWYTAASSGNA